MARLYEALRKAEEWRAAAQGSQLQPWASFTDAMSNSRITLLFYTDNRTVQGTADVAKA